MLKNVSLFLHIPLFFVLIFVSLNVFFCFFTQTPEISKCKLLFFRHRNTVYVQWCLFNGTMWYELMSSLIIFPFYDVLLKHSIMMRKPNNKRMPLCCTGIFVWVWPHYSSKYRLGITKIMLIRLECTISYGDEQWNDNITYLFCCSIMWIVTIKCVKINWILGHT
jgi:hypothetical protein